MRCTHKRYFLMYEDDEMVCGSNDHIWGNANAIKTCKQYIAGIRKSKASLNPRNFRIYDCDAETQGDGFAPCVYQEE